MIATQTYPQNCVCFFCSRHFRSEAGGDSAVRAALWEQAGTHAGGAVCGLHQAVGSAGGGAIPPARPGQPG